MFRLPKLFYLMCNIRHKEKTNVIINPVQIII